ncbi:hypothetical protein K435DRAFT_390964 [Dendrothele bispora CBS 962.96]|uniref:E2 ubiquitin-conjugating enzyme n=1 Tax=Dendrothele bispora (strain CBS 962.96) TaxID=1314807 RepID=A0A4S8MGE3_DENBC|nr:hypothetical protein K435DRAFT_390964 [Dendrothele bispora CBS 962.96]
MSVNQAAMRRILREIANLKKNPPQGIRVQTSEENIYDVTGIIEGPEETPYAGGYFKVKFRFTEEFPASPPKCWFATKIFHPNVSSSGEICVNTLKKDWKSTYGIEHILVTVKCLLIYPNPESALDEEAGKLLLENYDSYCSRAKLITSVHATPRVRPVEFDTPSTSSSSSSPKESSSESVKTTSVSEPSGSATTTSTTPGSKPTSTSVKSLPATAPFTLPIVTTRKSVSPAPTTVAIPLISSPSNLSVEKESLVTINKDRHPSPSPLGTADSNVTPPSSTMKPAAGPKAVKRAATGTASTVAEKRKKALKRL